MIYWTNNTENLKLKTISVCAVFWGFYLWSLCGGLWETLSWEWEVWWRRDSRGGREVQLWPLLRRRVLPGLHRRVLQRSEERHILSVHRYTPKATRQNIHHYIECVCRECEFGLQLFLQNATRPAKPALVQPIRTVMSAKKAGRTMTRKRVLVRGPITSLHVVFRKHAFCSESNVDELCVLLADLFPCYCGYGCNLV